MSAFAAPRLLAAERPSARYSVETVNNSSAASALLSMNYTYDDLPGK
jgi:hypothetical protein